MTGKNDGLPALRWGSVLDAPARQTGEASKELSAKVAPGPRQPTPGGLLATPCTHCCSGPAWLGHQQPLMDFRVLGLLQVTYLATSSSLQHQSLLIYGAPTGLVLFAPTTPTSPSVSSTSFSSSDRLDTGLPKGWSWVIIVSFPHTSTQISCRHLTLNVYKQTP